MLSSDELHEKARLMRQAPTACESRAHDSLPTAWAVQRQVVFGFYILDFVVAARLLVIEIDGDNHATQPAYDARRDAFCLEHGLRVLRIPNQLAHLAGVLAAAYPLVADGGKEWLRALGKAGYRQSFIEGKLRATPAERLAHRAERLAARAERRAAAVRDVQANGMPWAVSDPVVPAEPRTPRPVHLQAKRLDTPAQRTQRRADKLARRAGVKQAGMALLIAAVAARTEW